MTSTTQKLRALLNQICEERNYFSPASVSHLKDSLSENRHIFVNLLDIPPKNAEHRKTIQSCKTIINGKEFRINEDFNKQVLFLSDQLEMDEYEASNYLLCGITRGPAINLTPLDAAVVLFHEERGYILTVLSVILESARDQSLEETIRNVFVQFVADLAEEKSSSGTFVSKILKTVQDLAKSINTISKNEATAAAQPQPEQPKPATTTTFGFGQQQQQQAQTNTAATTTEQIKFAPTTTTLRIDKLTEERISLVQIMYHFASLCWLAESDILTLITLLQSSRLSDAICPYILISVLAAFSSPTTTFKTSSSLNFSKNMTTIKKIHDQITTKTFKVNALKESTQIQWALFLAEISKMDSLLEPNLPLKREARTKFVETAIDSNTFEFMSEFLLYFKKTDMFGDEQKKILEVDVDDSAMVIDGLIVDPNDYTKFNADISVDFQKYIVYELENLTKSFIFNMSDVFSNLKKLTMEEENSDDKHSLPQFLTLLASIYRDRMNAGLAFWDQRGVLSTFVAWLLDFKFPRYLAATFDFLGAISTGEQCAPLAHDVLKIGISASDIFASHLFSWGKLFSALQFYSAQYVANSAAEESPTMPANEEESLRKFLYLCQQVVQYSGEARMAIWADPVLKAHESIVNMISCPTSMTLRAALYDLLAAFCSSWGGGINHVGEKISLEVWNTLEFSSMVIPEKVMVPITPEKETIPAQPAPYTNTLFPSNNQINAAEYLNKTTKKPKQPTSYLLPEQPGLLKQFETEKNTRLYTQTISFVKFFANLIHTASKRDKLVSGFAPTVSSIPYCLGSNNNRPPGTWPYMSLVVDHILLNIKNLQFINPETKWNLVDACLAVIENSVMSLDLQPICDHIKWTIQHQSEYIANYSEALTGKLNGTVNRKDELQQALLACITHPGYDVLIRILSGGPLILELFKIAEQGADAFSPTNKNKNEYLRKAIVRCLRIFHGVSGIQNSFVNVFMPQLQSLFSKLPTGQFKLGLYSFPLPPPYFQSIGQLMLYDTDVIVQIAQMVNCDDYDTVCQLCASVLDHLATEPEDTKSDIKLPEHVNIPMGGIGSKLAGILSSSAVSDEIILGASERLDIDSGVFVTYDDHEYDINVIPFWLAEKTLGNVYKYDNQETLSFSSSVRIAIMDMLLKNLAKSAMSPTVAEFLLGYDVKDLQTSGAQSKSIPTDNRSKMACLMSILSLIESDDNLVISRPILAEKCYQLLYKLCVRESTSTATLFYLRNSGDFLLDQFKLITCRLERCLKVTQPLFSGVVICADGTRIPTDYFTLVSVLNQRAWLMKLIALELHQNAYKSSARLLQWLFGVEESSDTLAESFHLDNNAYQQPLWNMLDIINSLDFIWVDQLEEASLDLNYFKDFNAKRHMIQKDGYEIYDIRTIYKLLRQYQTTMAQTTNPSDAERTAIEMEMGAILKYYMADNRHREISYSRLHCLRAWKQVVQVTISDCFDSFSFEARERIIYDLLSLLLPKLERDTGLHINILKGLSDVVLSLLTRLREDKRRQTILQISPLDSGESYSGLPADKLRVVFGLIVNCIIKEKSTVDMRSTMYSALVNLLQYIMPDNNTDALTNSIRTQVTQLIMNEGNNNGLLNTICRDANQDVSVYQTSAFAALEALYTLVDQNNSTVMLKYLAKNNFIKSSIDLIKRSDAELLKIINIRDASLTPLNVHVAKMSFFIRLALKRDGAVLLLNNGILEKFAHCQFINTRIDNSKLKDNPNATERHSQLLTPILELVNVMLKSLSQVQGDEMRRFENWIVKQDIILYILQDDEKETTLSSLYVLQLITSLIYQLSRRKDYFLDLDKRDLSIIDSTMMNLIPKFCFLRDWATNVKPTNKQEIKWSTEIVNNHEATNVLVQKAEKITGEIRSYLLGYAESSTFRGGKTFTPIFANTLDSFKDIMPNSLRQGTNMTPSLTTLAACINFTGKRLNSLAAEYHALLAQKEDVGSLKYEEIHEIASTAIPKDLGIEFDGLNPSQQTQVLTLEINLRTKSKQKEIRDLVFTIDNALFVLWRHLEFYLDTDSIYTTTTFSPCERYANETVLLQQSLFQTSPLVISRLKKSCQTVLEPVIQKLESIPIINSAYGLSHSYKRIRKCYQ